MVIAWGCAGKNLEHEHLGCTYVNKGESRISGSSRGVHGLVENLGLCPGVFAESWDRLYNRQLFKEEPCITIYEV